MTELAIDGGKPYRSEPFPDRIIYGDEEVRMAEAAIRSQDLFQWSGHYVRDFETKFADFYGVQHAATSTSGTAAIHVAVGTIDPSPGDEIITAPITDLGSVTPILQQTAVPVFADIDPATFTMDPEDIERKITDRTKAILVVHLFGNACDMDAVMDIASRHDLPVIEDCSQAHATKYKGRYLGTIGDIGCFSLQGSKHMATGDGGVTITSNEAYWERMRFFVDKGFQRKGWGPRAYLFLAPNYRMNELTAAVAIPQIDKVRAVVERRSALGGKLSGQIENIDGLEAAAVTPGSEHSYWTFPLRTPGFDALEFGEALNEEGVSCSPGYIGKPIYVCAEALAVGKTFGDSTFPFGSPYTDRKLEYGEGMCPITDEALESLVTFSFNENYGDDDIEDIAGAIRKVAGGLRSRHGAGTAAG